MTIPERSKFVLALVTADQMMIPAPLARKLAECQDWLEEMAELGAVIDAVSTGGDKQHKNLRSVDADPRETIDDDQGGE